MSRERWLTAMNNLMNRRYLGTKGTTAEAVRIRDYKSHLLKVFVGKTVLDVGCGDMGISLLLLESTEYTGIDAFPISPAVKKMEVEEMDFEDEAFETVLCFAVLDGVCDIEKAFEQMKRVCKKNIVFLTGINIDPDKFHTYKITETLLVKNLQGFKMNYCEYLAPKVALIEFVKQ